jgi:hypothetical protein
MAGSKKQQKTEEVYTPVIPVVSCADETQVDRIAELCRIPRALTYNKLGSVKRWGLDGQKANPIVRKIQKVTDINLQSKLWEWSISDTMKAIAAPQEAAKVYVVRESWCKYPLSPVEKESRNWLKTALSVVNPAYTWQMCSQTGTLLGKQDGDGFTAYTGVVIQSDKNAALNILYRGSDSEINPWMKYAEVRKVLLLPTVRYLTWMGKSVTEAWDLGWINPKFKAEVLRLEDEYHRQG